MNPRMVADTNIPDLKMGRNRPLPSKTFPHDNTFVDSRINDDIYESLCLGTVQYSKSQYRYLVYENKRASKKPRRTVIF